MNGSRHWLKLLSSQVFGNWTFGTLVFTVMVFTVTLKVSPCCGHTPTGASLPAALPKLHTDTGTPMLVIFSGLLQFISGASKCALPGT